MNPRTARYGSAQLERYLGSANRNSTGRVW
jgi:hypothetical protein